LFALKDVVECRIRPRAFIIRIKIRLSLTSLPDAVRKSFHCPSYMLATYTECDV
jgi:hypothetical protein